MSTNDKYYWTIVLSDGTIKREGIDKFDLAWEEPNCVKSVEYSNRLRLDFETCRFSFDNQEINFEDCLNKDKSLILFKRRFVDFGSSDIKHTHYYLGFRCEDKKYIMYIDNDDKVVLPK